MIPDWLGRSEEYIALVGARTWQRFECDECGDNFTIGVTHQNGDGQYCRSCGEDKVEVDVE